MTNICPEVAALTEAAIALRRDLHEHAELSTEEHRTQGVILERLRKLGLEAVRSCADTGAVGVVRGAKPGPVVMWRADIDALPFDEQTGLPFASKAKAMHACGHDGHVAIALAMAEVLQAARERLAGTVVFAFQPAEEHVGGARRMIAEGIMRDPKLDRVFGLHIWAGTPLGQVLVQPGPIFAAATHFRIIVRGRGGHAAAPHETVDPIVTAAHVVTALQTVISRNVDAQKTAVLTIGRIEGGVRGNVIPNEVMMSGTVRTFDDQVLERVLSRMREIVSNVMAAFGGEGQFDTSTLAACVNDAESAAIVGAAAAGVLGGENVGEGRTMGGDDMAYFLEAAPGAYFMLGAGNKEKGIVWPHHHPKFDFDEGCLGLGIEIGLRIVESATGSALR